ncbi:MAG: hypothetical protein AB8B69_20110 [Chitinophagales bacterium]
MQTIIKHNYQISLELLISLLIFTNFVSAQINTDYNFADSLSVIELEYEVLDSNVIVNKNLLINHGYCNLVTYYDKGVKLAYYRATTNDWISIALPFSERTSDFELIDFDKNQQPEIIVRGEILLYGTGGGIGRKGMLIFNTDGVPKKIFEIYYGCWEESFGDRNNNGQGYYYNDFERDIKILNTSIIISSFDKKKLPYYECEDELTKIPNGAYIMQEGEFCSEEK